MSQRSLRILRSAKIKLLWFEEVFRNSRSSLQEVLCVETDEKAQLSPLDFWQVRYEATYETVLFPGQTIVHASQG